jgi:RHS repeat-associated protein
LNRLQSSYTGKERDAESGLDYFGARYYKSNMGRWMSPDYDGDSDEIEPVPHANFEYPQTLNLCTYVGNNPRMKDSRSLCEKLAGPTTSPFSRSAKPNMR